MCEGAGGGGEIGGGGERMVLSKKERPIMFGNNV